MGRKGAKGAKRKRNLNSRIGVNSWPNKIRKLMEKSELFIEEECEHQVHVHVSIPAKKVSPFKVVRRHSEFSGIPRITVKRLMPPKKGRRRS